MTRWLVVFTVAISGCVMSLPSDQGVSADLACEAARMVLELRQSKPPAPVSDACENCNGTGKIGDGRIVHTCPVCKGTGKKLQSVLASPVCASGTCRR